VSCCSLGDLINIFESGEKQDMYPNLTRKELLEGLSKILLIYMKITYLGKICTKFIHNDLTKEQILYGLKDNSWYLCDFGNSNISYWSTMTENNLSWDVIINIPGEPMERRSEEEELEELFEMFTEFLDDEMKEQIMGLVDKSSPIVSLSKLEYFFEQHQKLNPCNLVENFEFW